MAAKKSAEDPLTRTPGEVVEHRTPRAQPVGDVLEMLQAQAKDGMPESVFEDGATTERTPLMKRMRAEVGTAEVSAKRRDSNMQASVGIEVRCDRDEEGDAGRYHVRAGGHVARESQEGLFESQIPVSIEVNDEGGLKLNSHEMREEITNAIRSTDDTLKRKPPL
jgi:hypothetical protein